MTEGPIPAIRALSEKLLVDLSRALRTGHLTGGTATPFTVSYAVPSVSEAAAVELSSLLASGLESQHASLLLEALVAERRLHADAAGLELVTSGPDIAGTTRDTGVVLRKLFAEAEQRVQVVGFALHQGREIFAALAERMRHRPDLAVRLCLDIRRAPGDATRTDALLRRFVERFVRQEWPGPRLPDLFYDPRSLAEGEAHRASLHAKCVVVDGIRALIGSANLTEAAQQRNIEIGVVVSGTTAEAIEQHFNALIAGGHLRALPLL
jgi:phosphatidylserine/phosphatidylglycerophosphate/cardiolipin synthase-like enzyme